jgi:hypothetical protein
MHEGSVGAWDGSEVDSVGVTREDVNMNSEQGLRAKLQDLRITRAELDQDILSLERALSIMSGAHL